ncbi:hypothetical protein ACFLTH_08090, partial [Bacteroidota bacterium]
MKKILFLTVLVLLMLIPSVLGQNCGDRLDYSSFEDLKTKLEIAGNEIIVNPLDRIFITAQNKPITLYAPPDMTPPIKWDLKPFESDAVEHCFENKYGDEICLKNEYVNYPDDDTFTSDFPSLFSNPVEGGCAIDFKAVRAGEYYVFVYKELNPDEYDRLLVIVEDVYKSKGFGHECSVIDTSSCGDIFSFGDIMAFESISAGDIVSYGYVHSFGNLTVGDFFSPGVILSEDLVILPSAIVTGVVTTNNLILSSGASVSSN